MRTPRRLARLLSRQRLTLAGLCAVHSEVCGLVSLEPRLGHARAVHLDLVWMAASSHVHLRGTGASAGRDRPGGEAGAGGGSAHREVLWRFLKQ